MKQARRRQLGIHLAKDGGPDGSRTRDLVNAIHARSQLRHWPIRFILCPHPSSNQCGSKVLTIVAKPSGFSCLLWELCSDAPPQTVQTRVGSRLAARLLSMAPLRGARHHRRATKKLIER